MAKNLQPLMENGHSIDVVRSSFAPYIEEDSQSISFLERKYRKTILAATCLLLFGLILEVIGIVCFSQNDNTRGLVFVILGFLCGLPGGNLFFFQSRTLFLKEFCGFQLAYSISFRYEKGINRLLSTEFGSDVLDTLWPRYLHLTTE